MEVRRAQHARTPGGTAHPRGRARPRRQVLALLESLRDDQLIDTAEQTHDRLVGARDGLLGVPAGSADVEHRSHYITGWVEGERFRELLIAAGVR